MKKWEKPELKVLGVEDTRDGYQQRTYQHEMEIDWVCSIVREGSKNIT